jgi:hypothetical protein
VNENMSIYEENILGNFLPELLEVPERVGNNTSRAVEEDWRDEVLKTMKHLGVGLLEVN